MKESITEKQPVLYVVTLDGNWLFKLIRGLLGIRIRLMKNPFVSATLQETCDNVSRWADDFIIHRER